MAQAYSNPGREDDPHALPDIEVFYFDGEHQVGDCWEVSPAGWYWWSCFPGCLPDGDQIGPFKTEEDALADAQDQDE